ncbi:MAG: DMT family transporter [Campylobacterales bacterium]|nr:DMT family transporter [Campylobacterales bacterium]
MNTQNRYLIALLTSSFGVFLMSIESLLIKLTNISGNTYSFYIGFLIFTSMHLFLLIKEGLPKIIQIYKKEIRIILIAGIFTGLASLFFINSIKYTTVANTVIIISSSPLFATLFTYLLYKEKPQKNIFIASFFILAGLLVIFSSQISSGNLLGDFFAVLCTISFSLVFVLLAKHTQANRFIIIGFAGLCTSFFASFFIKSYQIDTQSIYLLLVAGLFVSPFSRVFLLLGTKILPASEVSLLAILETILAPLWAWIFLNELPVFNTVIGGMIILLTLVVNSLYLVRNSKHY